MFIFANPKALGVVLAMATLAITLSPGMAAESKKSKRVSSAVVTRVVGVEVVRGQTEWRVAPASKTRVTPAVQFYAGKRLWLVDRRSDRVSACRLIRSSTVGRDRIRCARRRLPN
jgi:hypothetical protein